VRAGWQQALGDWKGWLAIAGFSLVPMIAIYVIVVAVNSVWFGYNFWTQPAPTSAADTAAVFSLWFIVLLSIPVSVIAYGWYCQYARGEWSIFRSLRDSWRASVRSIWYAAPLVLVTAVAVLCVVPAVLVVAVVGPAPFWRLKNRPHLSFTEYLARAFLPSLVIGAIGALLGVAFWLMVLVTALLAGVSPPAAWIVGAAFYALGAVATGGIASAFRDLVVHVDVRRDGLGS
jgi:hypothetical protein